METTQRVWVTVPTYQEIENIDQVVRRVRAAVPDAAIYVVDDNSPDGTADKAEELAAEIGNMNVLRRSHKTGLGGAYRAGHAAGVERGYDVMVQIDADLSHDPADLPRLLAAVGNGADLAIGSRYVAGGSVPHWPKRRLMLSRWGNRYAGAMLRVPVNDMTAGYRAYRVDLLREIHFEETRADGYGLNIELTYRTTREGGRIDEVPISFTDRIRGQSKMSWRIIVEAMVLVTVWGIRDRVRRLTRSRR